MRLSGEGTTRRLAMRIAGCALVLVALPAAASGQGAKAIFDGGDHLEIVPVARLEGERGRGPRPPSPDSPPSLPPGPPAPAADVREEASATPRPLAVRYCLRRVDGTGRVLGEAPLGSEFRSGERVQLTVESSTDAYLAIVQHGSDGHRGLLYPPPAVGPAAAPIAARAPTILPGPRHAFTFDATPGTELLWLVLARDLAELAPLPLAAEMDAGDVAVLELLVARETGAKNLLVEALSDPGDPCTYAANVAGGVVVQEIALVHR